jgi:hypothetical protein
MWLSLIRQDAALPERAYVDALRSVINKVNNASNGSSETLSASDAKLLRELHAVLCDRVDGYDCELWGAAQKTEIDASTQAAINAASCKSGARGAGVVAFLLWLASRTRPAWLRLRPHAHPLSPLVQTMS